jgi:6-phosphogluconate dehydrogenase
MSSRIGMIGLGRMGGNMSRRIARAGFDVVAWDRSAEARSGLGGETRVETVTTLADLVARLPAPRIVWLMLPAGAPTDETLATLAPLLAHDDIVVDGANARYSDSQARAAALAGQGIAMLDVGVSGGVWGLDNGYGLMVGGEAGAVARLEPFLRALAPAPDRGWLHCGPSGAGHFVKMVHNGIEYGMMAALAEGLNVLAKADIGATTHDDDAETAPLDAAPYYRFDLDLAKVTEVWRRGSVISSWLLDLTAEAFHADPHLDAYSGVVSDSGEGRWTIAAAIDEGVPTPVLAAALFQRFTSRGRSDVADKALSAMRAGFGGHVERTASSR